MPHSATSRARCAAGSSGTAAIAAVLSGGHEAPTYAELSPMLDTVEDAPYFHRLAADLALGKGLPSDIAGLGVTERALSPARFR